MMEDLLLLGWYAVLTVGVVLVHANRRGNLDAYARSMSLVVPAARRDELAAVMAARRRPTRRDGLVGLAFGLLIGVGVLLLGGSGSWAGTAVLWSAMLGIALATRTAIVEIASSSGSGGARVARLMELTGDDFSTRWERAGVRLGPVMAAMSAIAPIVVVLVSPEAAAADDALAAAAAAACLVALAVWLVLRRAERQLVAEPQAARDADDLAWLDALRASAVRDLRSAAGVVGLVSSFLALSAAGHILVRVQPTLMANPPSTASIQLVVTGVWLLMLGVPMLVLELLGRRSPNPALRLRSGQAR